LFITWKAHNVPKKPEMMKLGKAAGIVREGIEETLRYYAFPSEYWLRIRTNNPLGRITSQS
jgi:transposase-like protein